MKFKAILRPGEDGWVVAEVPALPGCISQGRTKGEARRNVREAIEGWLEVAEARKVAKAGRGETIVEVAV